MVTKKWSGRPDSNRRPSGPKPDALPGCATPRPDDYPMVMSRRCTRPPPSWRSRLLGVPPRTERDASVATSSVRLWYRQPAASWNEALPIGNGRLGAMVFGGVESEKIQLNEDTIWAGEKRDRNNPEGLKNLAEVRRLLFAG